MSTRTGIEWTDATWNPLRGCSRVSEGCRHCYAERVAARFSGPGLPYEGLAKVVGRGARWTGEIRVVREHMGAPIRWRRPRRVFVNSMSDLFHEGVSDETITEIFTVMAIARHHTFQVLTKRPRRMRDYLEAPRRLEDIYACWTAFSGAPAEVEAWPLPNVQLGVSVEHQPAADERIPLLLETPAAVRFLSMEPLLAAVDIRSWLAPAIRMRESEFKALDVDGRRAVVELARAAARAHGAAFVDWVIVGGESGPGARPMHPDWVRSLRNQCVVAGIPFFFKQWGEFAPIAPVYPDDVLGDVDEALHDCDDDKLAAVEPSGAVPQFGDRCDYQPCPGSWWMELVGKKRAGRVLDGRTWDELPAAPAVVAT